MIADTATKHELAPACADQEGEQSRIVWFPLRAGERDHNIFLRGRVYWGRIKIRGRDHKWSLRTGDINLARERVREGYEWLMSKEGFGRTKMTALSDYKPRIHGKDQLYFVASGEFVKIGFTKHPAKRLEAIRTSIPYDIEVIAIVDGSRDDEARLHQQFAHLRVRGEWFRREPELVAFIDQIKGNS